MHRKIFKLQCIGPDLAGGRPGPSLLGGTGGRL